MKIIINNKETEVKSTLLSDIIKELNLENQFLAITKNGTLIKKANWNKETLNQNDKLDIFSPASGG